jgi:energy-coupling factor transporter ATP-binding protein EcfA2
MAVIIGRNGTGKTQVLAQFAQAMSGLTTGRSGEFIPERPSFSRVIAVSYSVFDDFVRPRSQLRSDRTFSYKYCGIRSPDPKSKKLIGGSGSDIESAAEANFLSPAKLTARLLRSRKSLREQDRDSLWKEILGILLEGTVNPSDPAFEDLSLYNRLSSGQRILVAIITEIVAYIEPQSVILFDEPELHLHPEVFSALVRAFDKLLQEFDSFAIVATHSPLLLQETLSRQVRVFRRRGNIPIVQELSVESFGENLTSITQEVFAVDRSALNFRAHLKELLIGKTVREVEDLFPLGLPLQAQAYLRTLSSFSKE